MRLRFRKLSSLTTALAFLLAIAMQSVPAFAASDLDGHWAQSEIVALQASGTIQGYPDGTFKPDNSISRAEFVTILNRAAQLDAAASAGRFADVAPDAWYDGQVGAASVIGYINGFEDSTFRPDQPVTRNEVAVILARALSLAQTGTPSFTDWNQIPQWAAPSVAAAAAAGYMKGYPDGSFGGDRPVTRAEASVLIYRSQAVLIAQVPRVQTVFVTDESGNPVPNAVVRVHRKGQKKFLASQETDADGQAIFVLRPDQYEITASTSDLVGHQAYTVGYANGTVQLAISKAAVLTGRLVDENGQPMAGVAVTFTTNPTFITTTDANGAYRVPVLPEREYRVSVFNSVEELREPQDSQSGSGAGTGTGTGTGTDTDTGAGTPTGEADAQGLSIGTCSAPAAGETADVGEATVVQETGKEEESTPEQPGESGQPEQPVQPEQPQEPGPGEQPGEVPAEPEPTPETPSTGRGGGGGHSHKHDDDDDADRSVADVGSLAAFKAALSDPSKAVINLTNDFTTVGAIVVNRPVIINGNGHTIRCTSDDWDELRVVLYVDNTRGVTIRDITLTGADMGLVVDDAEVTLEGTIDASGNEYLGIEVLGPSSGDGLPRLIVSGATLMKSSDPHVQPTICVHHNDEGAIGTVIGREDQFTPEEVAYYLEPEYLVHPPQAKVGTLDALKAALANGAKRDIVLTADIATTEEILVERSVNIDGNGHTIRFTGDESDRQGKYVLHVANTTDVHIWDITLTGGDAGLLVDGSDVRIYETVDLSGNESCGIKVTTNEGASDAAKLDVSQAILVNTSEAYGKPTMWVNNAEVVIRRDQFTNSSAEGEGGTLYYLNAENAVDFGDAAVNVGTLDDFKTALQDKAKTLINLTDNLTTPEEILVDRSVIINGHGHTIRFTGDETDLDANYVLHVYNTTGVVIKNITLTGGDAGLLVDSAEVKLEGTVNVSGNELGGIEIRMSDGTEYGPELIVTDVDLINTTEAYGRPTIWEEQVTGSVTGEGRFTQNDWLEVGAVQHYLDEDNAVGPNDALVETLTQLKVALENEANKFIILTGDILTDEPILVARPVTIIGEWHAIGFVGDEKDWQGNVVLHISNTSGVTLRNIELGSGDVGLWVESAEVTLEGDIYLQWNELGGIKISAAEDSTRTPHLTTAGAYVDCTEAYGQPTIWEDQVTGTVEADEEQFTVTSEVKEGQVHYYLYATHAVDPNAGTETFTVTFDENGGDTEADPSTMQVKAGQTVGTLPSAPTRDGYTFEGWATASDATEPDFDETTEVTGDITVYAVWAPVEELSVEGYYADPEGTELELVVYVSYGTPAGDALALLPSTGYVKLSSGTYEAITISWDFPDGLPYAGDKPGPYPVLGTVKFADEETGVEVMPVPGSVIVNEEE